MKFLLITETANGYSIEEQEPRQDLLAGFEPEIRHEAALIFKLMEDFPDAGNHYLYGLYRNAKGAAPWKVFRRALALARGGPDADRVRNEDVKNATRNAARKRELEERAETKRRAEEARRKKKEEEPMATIRREDLRRGQSVWVRVRFADQMKLKPAKINEVMRAAVNVTVEGDNGPRTVRFNEIELSPEGSDKAVSVVASPAAPPQVAHPHGALTAVPPAFAALAGGHGVQEVEKRHPHVEVRRPHQAPPQPQVETRRQPEPPPQPAAPPAVDTLGQVNAWIEQGSAMRDGLLKQREQLQAEMDALAHEALRIEESIGTKRAEQARVTALLAALDQMRAAAA